MSQRNLVLTFGLMQVGRKLPLDTPQATLYLRVAYLASQAIQFAVLFFIGRKIQSKNDLTTLKYVEPAGPASQEPPKAVTTTVRDYDLTKVAEQRRSMLMGILMLGVMHFYFKYTQPLFIQSILPLKSLFDNQEVKIHLLGQPATGDLARPFKAPSMFGASTVQTDSASVAAAEKTSGAVKKDQ